LSYGTIEEMMAQMLGEMNTNYAKQNVDVKEKKRK
jgi:hypothetical protein